MPVAKPQHVLTKPFPQLACWLTDKWFVIEHVGSVIVASPPGGAEPEAVDSGAEEEEEGVEVVFDA